MFVNWAGVANYSVFPNPFSEQLTIRGLELGVWKVSVIDQLGNEVWEGRATVSLSRQIQVMPQISNGIYVLQLTSAEGRVYQKRLVKN